MFDDVDRGIAAIRLPKWGRVVPAAGTAPWLLVDDEGEPVRRFLVDGAERHVQVRHLGRIGVALAGAHQLTNRKNS